MRRSLAISKKKQGVKHVATASDLNELGWNLRLQERYEEAEPLLLQALEIRQDLLGDDDINTGISLSNVGSLRQAQGDFRTAHQFYERALAVLEKATGKDDPQVAICLDNMSGMLVRQGRLEEAEKVAKRALAIRKSKLDPKHALITDSIHGLGWIMVQRGRYGEAEGYLRDSLRRYEKGLGEESRHTAASAGLLGTALKEQGRLAEAAPLIRRSLAIERRVLGPRHPRTIYGVLLLAEVEQEQGRPERAWALVREARESTRERVHRLFASANEAERFRYMGEQARCLRMIVSLALESEDPEHRDVAYSALLDWKGQVFRSTEWLRRRVSAGLSASQLETLGEFRAVQAELSKLFGARVSRDRAARARRLEHLIARRTKLEDGLIQSLRDHWVETSGDVARISSSLPKGSTLVDLHIRDAGEPGQEPGEGVPAPGGRVSAWIVRAGARNVVHVDLGDAVRIRSRVERLLRGMSPKSSTGLREVIWDPIRKAVGESKQVFLSPDAFLATLPFEVLLEADGKFLIEKHAFVYLQSAKSLGREQERRRAPSRSLLAVGAVDYDDGEKPRAARVVASLRGPVEGRWPTLPGTALEIDDVRGRHEAAFGESVGRRIVTRAAATEECLKLELPKAGFVHLATHGFFRPEGRPSLLDSATAQVKGPRSPRTELAGYLPGLLTGLVCAGANGPTAEGRDDGLLTAEEVAWLDMSRCDLVVLAACETALGSPRAGEALMSLRRAFRQAGARTVVSSLWRVDDASTRELMRRFYLGLWSGKLGKAAALRAAQLEILQRNRKRRGKPLPRTWGGFVLSGDWR